jgi:hypothetical protein
MGTTEKVRMYFGGRSIYVTDEKNRDLEDPQRRLATKSAKSAYSEERGIHFPDLLHFIEDKIPDGDFISWQPFNGPIDERAPAEINSIGITILKKDYLQLKDLVNRLCPQTDNELKQAETDVRQSVERIVQENHLDKQGQHHALLWSTYEQVCNKMGRTIYSSEW